MRPIRNSQDKINIAFSHSKSMRKPQTNQQSTVLLFQPSLVSSADKHDNANANFHRRILEQKKSESSRPILVDKIDCSRVPLESAFCLVILVLSALPNLKLTGFFFHPSFAHEPCVTYLNSTPSPSPNSFNPMAHGSNLLCTQWNSCCTDKPLFLLFLCSDFQASRPFFTPFQWYTCFTMFSRLKEPTAFSSIPSFFWFQHSLAFFFFCF